MIDFSKIISSAQKKAIAQSMCEPVIEDIKETAENKEFLEMVKHDKAHMKFAISLLEEYHKELKAELQKSGINLD